jgi:hypothetical protein
MLLNYPVVLKLMVGCTVDRSALPGVHAVEGEIAGHFVHRAITGISPPSPNLNASKTPSVLRSVSLFASDLLIGSNFRVFVSKAKDLRKLALQMNAISSCPMIAFRYRANKHFLR